MNDNTGLLHEYWGTLSKVEFYIARVYQNQGNKTKPSITFL